MALATALASSRAPTTAAAHVSPGNNENELPAIAASGLFGAVCGTLPDLIEPANNPNHRQFFHSIAFGAILSGGLWHLWQWRPDREWQIWARRAGLVAGGAYLVHLMLDSTTPKGLPVLGKL